MPFDPKLPVEGSDAEAAEMRAQFTGLKDISDDLQTQINTIPAGPPGPQGIQGPPGNDGADGAEGPPGPPISSPLSTTAVFDAPVHLGTQELKFDTSRDIGGSAEGLAGISATDTGEGPLLQVRCRVSGSDRSMIRLDFAGILAGSGTPTVSDGDLYCFDAAAQALKPISGVTEDVEVKDSFDGVSVLHFVNGLYMGRTTGP